MVVPEPQAVIPNTTVHFKCTFKGTPPFTVKWFKEDTELITGPSCFIGIEGLSSFIDLYAVGLSNTGPYSCQVSNDAGTEKCTTSLLVKGLTFFFCSTVTILIFFYHLPLFSFNCSLVLLVFFFVIVFFCCLHVVICMSAAIIWFILHLFHSSSTFIFLAVILCSSSFKPSLVLTYHNKCVI